MADSTMDMTPTDGSERRPRRKRLQLNCGECRQKKLSCDRKLPCSRCVRSGRPHQCSFERSQPIYSGPSSSNLESQPQSNEVQALWEEIDRLKKFISKPHLPHETEAGGPPLIQNITNTADFDPAANKKIQIPIEVPLAELSDPTQKSPRGYYSQHTLLRFFTEIPQLFPFIKETSDQWFKPRGIGLRKRKTTTINPQTVSGQRLLLEDLLPSKADTDLLVELYLKNFECIHRINHVPTFKRQYANFWTPGNVRHPAMSALVLSMISISISSCDSVSSTHRAMPVQWITACQEWLNQQSSKHRKLIHYQVSCLLYLAKRMNMIKKKTWWKDTGCLIQDAVMDGLHCEPFPVDSPYMREMKRRIWYTIRELELQNSFEYGLPSLLHTIESNILAPMNISDEDFDETSRELPESKSPKNHTLISYQYQSSWSWALRLELSRRLYSTGTSSMLSYEEVLHYTHKINQMLDSLPTDHESLLEAEDRSKCLQVAYLDFQLKELLLTIHRPYIHQYNRKFWLSENITYQVSREILFLNNKLGILGVQAPTFLGENLLLASLSIARVTLLQSNYSTNIIVTNHGETIDLLERCLPFMEQRYIRCFSGEPWCFLTMHAAIMLLKLHVGEETPDSARSSCGRRFLDLYDEYVEGEQELPPTRQNPADITDCYASHQQSALAGNIPTSEWPDSNFLDIQIDPFDCIVEFQDHIWDSMAWPAPLE